MVDQCQRPLGYAERRSARRARLAARARRRSPASRHADPAVAQRCTYRAGSHGRRTSPRRTASRTPTTCRSSPCMCSSSSSYVSMILKVGKPEFSDRVTPAEYTRDPRWPIEPVVRQSILHLGNDDDRRRHARASDRARSIRLLSNSILITRRSSTRAAPRAASSATIRSRPSSTPTHGIPPVTTDRASGCRMRRSPQTGRPARRGAFRWALQVAR